MDDVAQAGREVTAFKVPSAFSGSDEQRRRGLRRMRQVALSLLVLAAVVFALTHGRAGWLGFVNAGSEAAMVGAIADWFAVTALFRRPLGLPIPHTALIPNRKEALGVSLQEFVADNFLSEPVVRERVRSAQISLRVASWLAVPAHSRRVADEASYIVREGVRRVKDDDVAALVQETLIPRLLEEPLSPVAGQMLHEVVRDDAHRGLVDLAVDELHRWLVENEDAVTRLVADRAPWWTPQWLDERVTDRLYREALALVADIAGDPDHHARKVLDDFALQLAEDLQHDPETQRRAERLKERVLSQPRVASTAISLWNALKRALVESLGDPDGLLRRRGLEELRAVADRVVTEPDLRDRLDELLCDAAAFVVNNYGSEIATIISETVNRWDGKEAARRIELHVGRDLQFIRINGTVVGGLAGVVIHAVSLLL
ncbi:MAG: DUF445 domain-containing protein [Nocardioidaceae bacterium]